MAARLTLAVTISKKELAQGPELLCYLKHEERGCGSLLEKLGEVRHHHLSPEKNHTQIPG